MISGPLAYETLQSNLPHTLPTLSYINKYITRVNSNITEGVLRCAELKKYIDENNLPNFVSLSEDTLDIGYNMTQGQINWLGSCYQLI